MEFVDDSDTDDVDNIEYDVILLALKSGLDVVEGVIDTMLDDVITVEAEITVEGVESAELDARREFDSVDDIVESAIVAVGVANVDRDGCKDGDETIDNDGSREGNGEDETDPETDPLVDELIEGDVCADIDSEPETELLCVTDVDVVDVGEEDTEEEDDSVVVDVVEKDPASELVNKGVFE